jgi:hypothetical protein
VGGDGSANASNSGTFGLYLEMQWDPEDSKPILLEFEFAAKRKTSGNFVELCNYEITFNSEWAAHGYDDLFEMPWLEFIANNGLFIDGVLHLRANVAMVGQPKLQA